MSFWRGLFSGATPTGENVANAVMMRRQKDMEDARRAEERQWAKEDMNTNYQNQLGILGKQGENAMNLANANNVFTAGENEKDRNFRLDMFDAQGNFDLKKLGIQHKNAMTQIAQKNQNEIAQIEKQYGYDSEQAKIAREWQGYQKAAERQWQQTQNAIDRDIQSGKIKSQEEYQQMALKQQRLLGILNALPQVLMMAEDNPALMEQVKVTMQNLIAPTESGEGGDFNADLQKILNPTQDAPSSEAEQQDTPASRLGIQTPENDWSRLNNYKMGDRLVNPAISRWFNDNFKADVKAPYFDWNR